MSHKIFTRHKFSWYIHSPWFLFMYFKIRKSYELLDHDDILPPYYLVNTNNPLYVWGYLFLTPGNLIVKEDFQLSFLYLNKKNN